MDDSSSEWFGAAYEDRRKWTCRGRLAVQLVLIFRRLTFLFETPDGFKKMRNARKCKSAQPRTCFSHSSGKVPPARASPIRFGATERQRGFLAARWYATSIMTSTSLGTKYFPDAQEQPALGLPRWMAHQLSGSGHHQL